MDTTTLNQAIANLEAECQHSDSYTPIQLATERGEHEIVSALADGGANLNAANTLGETPLEAAICEGHLETVRVLVEKGADINLKPSPCCRWEVDACPITPLFMAVQYDKSTAYVGILKVLLDNGADLSATDNKGRTPRDIVVAKFKKYGGDGYKETITYMDTHIAQVNSECRMTASTTRQKGLPEVMDGEIMAFLRH